MEDRQFLKSILPLSDELNTILGMIFEMDPTRRITLEQLRNRIYLCPQFTKNPQYVDTPLYEDYDEPLSPVSTISDEGSMVSDHSDNSAVPSEVDTEPSDILFETKEDVAVYPHEDSTYGSGLEEDDVDLSFDPTFHGSDSNGKLVNGIQKPWNSGPVVPQKYVIACTTPVVVDSGIYHRPQGPQQISSHIVAEAPVATQTREHRRPGVYAAPVNDARLSPDLFDDGKASSTRSPAKYMPQQSWSRARTGQWQSVFNHSLAPRITTLV
jgi:hypothetical protein